MLDYNLCNIKSKKEKNFKTHLIHIWQGYISLVNIFVVTITFHPIVFEVVWEENRPLHLWLALSGFKKSLPWRETGLFEELEFHWLSCKMKMCMHVPIRACANRNQWPITLQRTLFQASKKREDQKNLILNRIKGGKICKVNQHYMQWENIDI